MSLENDVEVIKEKLIETWVEPNSLEEKRSLYKCKKYVTIDKFVPWSTFGKKVKSNRL